MSNESFKIKNALTLTPCDLTSLTNPQAGDLACDINDLNKIKRYDANSLGWTEVGSGGVGNVNALLTQTFDTAALAQFTQTGLALTTSNPIDGTQSARLIHQAASSQSFKQVIAVDRKYRGDLMAMSLQVRSSATSGNLTLLVTDETNSAVIMASSSISTGQYQVATAVTNTTTTISGFSNVDINLLKVGMTITGAGIPTATVISSINTAANTIVISQAATASATITAKFSALPDRKSFSFTIPTNCASLSYTVTALQEAGLPESYVDDVVIELANVSLLETSVTVPNITRQSSVLNQTASFGASTNISGALTSSTGSGIFSYNSSTGVYTMLKSATVNISAALQTSAVAEVLSQIYVNGVVQSTSTSVATGLGKWAACSIDQVLSVGTTFYVYNIVNTTSGQLISITATAYETSSVSIPLTQSGLVQEADTSINMSAGTTLAAANFLFTTTNKFIGSAISYNGATGEFTVLKEGIYDASAFAAPSGNASPSIQLQVDGVTRSYTTIYPSTGAGGVVSFSERLLVGQKIKLVNLNNTSSAATITITQQGSLNQVSVNTNSKITIPTSELRFEGASTRGSTDTAIVKFDTQAKIRGDAFSVVNTAANGTAITMLKAGKLEISTSLYRTLAGNVQITKNQAVLTSSSTSSAEVMVQEYTNGIDDVLSASWSGFVNVGDVFRISSSSSIVPNFSNIFNLSFQEQEIQVSVSNTLPQFSESDSCVRLSGANGYGSTNLTTRRFASTVQNIGSDIQYIDSPTLGGQFIAQSSGIYNVSFSESSTVSSDEMSVVLTLNGVNLAVDNQRYNTASTLNKSASVSWQGYLTAGDIISALVVTAANNNGGSVLFTISKVGKPNVTGVNVTPFVNVPQPVSQSSYVDQVANFGATAITGALTKSVGSNIYSYNLSNGVYTVLKAGQFNISAMLRTGSAASVISVIVVNNVNIGLATSLPTAFSRATASFSGTLQAGDTFYVSGGAAVTSDEQKISVLATASADTILTAPETFSTDTAALTYAGSGTYTFATLANAAVGTYLTYTYTANTNTRTQTTARPTQTDADMNTNGIRVFTRAFGSTSTAGSPTTFAIQIGKGMKGINKNGYFAVGKLSSVELDFYVQGTTIQRGLRAFTYNEINGILLIDAGQCETATITDPNFNSTEQQGTIASSYIVISASKNPALTGMNLNRVAAKGVNSSAPSFPNTGVDTTVTFNSVKEYDTTGSLNAATGVYTAPETGYYQVNACIMFDNNSWTVGNVTELALFKNSVIYSSMGRGTAEATITSYRQVRGSDIIYLAKGDNLRLSLTHTRSGGAATLIGTPFYNYFSIVKVSV